MTDHIHLSGLGDDSTTRDTVISQLIPHTFVIQLATADNDNRGHTPNSVNQSRARLTCCFPLISLVSSTHVQQYSLQYIP